MSFKASVNFVIYELYPKQYVIPPEEIICCPKCRGNLSKSEIPPSKAVTSWLAGGTIAYHVSSHLYECLTCHWWAVWEVYGDAEYGAEFDYLMVGRSDSNSVSLNNPWEQTLENEKAHDHDYEELLPKALEEVLVNGKKRVLDLPKPGDKVRLIGDVHVLLGAEERFAHVTTTKMVPFIINGSEGIVVGDEELYSLIRDKHEKPEWAKNHLVRLKVILRDTNSCPVRLEKLVTSPTGSNMSSCKIGEIYFIDAVNIKKLK